MTLCTRRYNSSSDYQLLKKGYFPWSGMGVSKASLVAEEVLFAFHASGTNSLREV
jgi:hypothetical protein